MNRAQRRAHARLWPILILVLLSVSAAALVAKARIDSAAIEAVAVLAGDE
ncbi:MAG: hypothetical protein H7124_02660 [Phycisphaerales bacterium]|nr:hypothetical protein [Hyphomonadaceae bacterium]